MNTLFGGGAHILEATLPGRMRPGLADDDAAISMASICDEGPALWRPTSTVISLQGALDDELVVSPRAPPCNGATASVPHCRNENVSMCGLWHEELSPFCRDGLISAGRLWDEELALSPLAPACDDKIVSARCPKYDEVALPPPSVAWVSLPGFN